MQHVDRPNAANPLLFLAKRCMRPHARSDNEAMSQSDLQSLIKSLKVGAPEDARRDAARALANLADSDNTCALIVDAGALGPLVNLLSDGSDDAKEQTARALAQLASPSPSGTLALACLANSGKRSDKIINAGAVRPLVLLLNVGSMGAKQQAANALGKIALSSERGSVQIVKAGALHPMVTLLRGGSEDAKKEAAFALGHLGRESWRTAQIIAAGAVQPLVELMRDGSGEGPTVAAYALGNISDCNSKVTGQIISAGALQPLIKLLVEGVDTTRDKAAAVLGNLAGNDSEERSAQICNAGALEPLVALLKEGSEHARTSAAFALSKLVLSKERSAQIVKAGALQPLVRLMKVSGYALGIAVMALKNLATHHEGFRKQMIKAGVPAGLVERIMTTANPDAAATESSTGQSAEVCAICPL